MISIIICSRDKTISADLRKNIEGTIGCSFELIVIDNSRNQYSIFEAYNLGIGKSVGEYLCFIHDDILFHTQGWGAFLTSIFTNNQDYGLIGIAGASQKTKIPSGWWECEERYKSINIIQHYHNGKKEREQLGFRTSVLNEVVVVDGVFLALRKNINAIFNPLLKGFHNYDLNIAIETRKKGYKIGVTNQILIEHFSIGNLNKEWIQATITAHKLYRKFLPLSVDKLTNNETEIFSCKKFITHSLACGNTNIALEYCFKLFFLEPFSKSNFSLYKKTIIKIIR
jgi:hypothetical protein